MKKLFLRDGKLWYNEFPEEPQYDAADSVRSVQKMHYDKSVDESKIAAVEILIYGQATPDLSLAKDVRGWWIQTTEKYFGELMQEGQLYDISQGWTVEYSEDHCQKQHCRSDDVCEEECQYPRKVARLVPIKEQSSGIAAVGVAEYGDFDAETLPEKGDKNGECNRTACSNFGAMWYNTEVEAGIPESGDNRIIEAMFNAQFGSKEQCSAIEEHMKEYFQRWPSYKDRLNHLEWYHLFLDFSDFLEKRKSVSPPPQDSQDIWQSIDPNRPKYIMLTNVHTEGMPLPVLDFWAEVENWYGDISKKETGEQLLKRMLESFNVTRKAKP